MKKGLLLASMLLAGASAFAAVDTATYPAKDGLTFTNISMNCELNGNWMDLIGQAFPSSDYVRTATVLDGKVYVLSSKIAGADGLADSGLLVVFDAATGNYEKSIQLTVDGANFSEGLLGANKIGHDYYGNLWVAGYKGVMFVTNSDGEEVANPIKVFSVDPATGACTKQAELALMDGDQAYGGRVDFIDVAGDLTRKEARCVVMAAPSGAAETYVYGWGCEQNDSEWYGWMNGNESVVATASPDAFYPALANFNGGTTVQILYDEELECANFYVDDMNCAPSMLNTEGAGVENFSAVSNPSEDVVLVPKTNPSGCCDFVLGGKFYFMYGIEEYDGDQACRSNLVRLGEGGTFADMELMYTFPEAGLGHQKGGPGARVHNFEANVVTDDNGKQGAYVFTYKTGNGYAYYLLAEDGFKGGAGVEAPAVDEANAPVEYFNLQGVRVANPENGIFVRRQGSKVSKVAVK